MEFCTGVSVSESGSRHYLSPHRHRWRKRESVWVGGERERGRKHTQIRNRPDRPVRLERRNDLPRNRVTGDARKVVVPDPLGDLLVTGDADGLVGAERLLLARGVHGVKLFGEAAAHEQDIALAEGGALVLGHGFQLVERDGVAVEALVLDALGLRVRAEIEEYTAANEAATLMPVCIGWRC